ncbi:MAG: YdcF family protein [Solirubrobacterales bacterium]
MIRIFIGVLCIIYFIVLRVRGISFSTFFVLAGVFFVAWGLTSMKHGYEFSLRYHKLSMLINIVTTLVVISFVLVEGLITYNGMGKDTAKTDYIIVLGAGLWGDTPSDVLYKRLDAALECIRINPEAEVIVSGGQGPGETITEAEAMQKYLVSKGIPKDKILMEDKSTSTEQNLNNSQELIKKIYNDEDPSVTVVTSNFHMLRAKLIGTNLGFNVHEYSAPILTWLIPVCYIREYFAIIKYFIF